MEFNSIDLFDDDRKDKTYGHIMFDPEATFYPFTLRLNNSRETHSPPHVTIHFESFERIESLVNDLTTDLQIAIDNMKALGEEENA